MAVFAVDQLAQPADSRIVDCFCDIEPEIEAAVIAASKDKHELSRFVFGFADF
jgi:hypothetical protein